MRSFLKLSRIYQRIYQTQSTVFFESCSIWQKVAVKREGWEIMRGKNGFHNPIWGLLLAYLSYYLQVETYLSNFFLHFCEIIYLTKRALSPLPLSWTRWHNSFVQNENALRETFCNSFKDIQSLLSRICPSHNPTHPSWINHYGFSQFSSPPKRKPKKSRKKGWYAFVMGC